MGRQKWRTRRQEDKKKQRIAHFRLDEMGKEIFGKTICCPALTWGVVTISESVYCIDIYLWDERFACLYARAQSMERELK